MKKLILTFAIIYHFQSFAQTSDSAFAVECTVYNQAGDVSSHTLNKENPSFASNSLLVSVDTQKELIIGQLRKLIRTKNRSEVWTERALYLKSLKEQMDQAQLDKKAAEKYQELIDQAQREYGYQVSQTQIVSAEGLQNGLALKLEDRVGGHRVECAKLVP